METVLALMLFAGLVIAWLTLPGSTSAPATPIETEHVEEGRAERVFGQVA